MNAMKAPVDFVARVLMSSLFLYSAYLKISDYDRQQAYAHNDFATNLWDFAVPEFLFWIAIAFEIIAGIMLILGMWTRITAFLLAGYSLITAMIFHSIGAFDIDAIPQIFAQMGAFTGYFTGTELELLSPEQMQALEAERALWATITQQNANIGQSFNFLKNVTIIGGMLLLVANGAGAWSADAMRKNRM